MLRQALSTPRARPWFLASVVALFALVLMATGAQAQIPDYAGCVDDFQPGSVCTANDVTIGSLVIYETLDTCASVNDTGTYIFQATLVAGASERYDIGLFIALDGLSAQDPSRLANGASCYHDYLTPVSTTPNPTSGTGPFLDAEVGGDTCGDLAQGVINYYLTAPLTISCFDFNPEDGIVDDISTCVSWDNQKNGRPICTSVAGAYPNTKSKCRCETISIPDAVIRQIVVDKVTDPAGDPQIFDFTLTKPDNSTVNFTLTDTDDPWLSGLLPAVSGYSVFETVPEGWDLTDVTCTNGIDPDNIDPANIDLTENREVRCTFTNTKQATITVEKVAWMLGTTTPYCPGRVFGFNLAGAHPSTVDEDFELRSNVCPPSITPTSVTYSVAPGTYTVMETDADINQLPDGWTLVSVECDNLNGVDWTGTPSQKTAAGSLTAGQEVTCTFTNRPESSLAVTLAGFYAEQVADYVQVTWETVSELSNRGFNLYRATSAAGPFTRLNTALIPSQSQGSPSGFTYTWQDRAGLAAGTDYYYLLEDLDLSGATTSHGPVSVSYVGPTAVGFSAVQASPAAGAAALPWLLVVAGAGAALGMSRLRRRN